MTDTIPKEPIDVAILYSIPSPYQENLFELVGNREGINLHVYYCKERPADRDWNIDSGEYSYESLPGVTIHSQYLNPSIVRRVADKQPDVVIVGGYSHPTMQLGIVTARTLGLPVILWSESHDRDWSNREGGVSTKLKNRLLPLLIKQCSGFLVPGGLQRQYLERRGAATNSIFRGTHACNVEQFYVAARQSERAETHDRYGITEDIVLTFVGRLIEEKGLSELIDAAASVSTEHGDVGFVIAGSGSYEDELRRRCETHGLTNVYFPGFVHREQLPPLYGASDVFVFPSRGDPWGVVVNEAMACELPVITTDAVGAGYDLVNDGVNGAIVPPNDADALAEAITEVVTSDYVDMGRRSSQIIEKWTHEHAADSVVDAVRWSVDSPDLAGSPNQAH
ncbi:glycosyltransferase family 4 protein [Halostella salina]|uniref:glycosyltransferase family 4 protein n=1 Tax=Halostella salina TaxID=1547897 RepID=UPI000EF81EDD|nr:glycosyltransferase family 4 protein [Halostella salina]